jgi:hypothetical protein
METKNANNMNFVSTAKVSYRDHVPYGWFAIKYCTVEFFGKDAQKLHDEWHDIEYAKFRKNKPIIEEFESKAKIYREAIRKSEEALTSNKKWWRFWKTKEDKKILADISKNKAALCEAKDIIKKHEDNRYYSAAELHIKAKSFLREKGFLLYDCNSSGDECVDHTEMWGYY